MKKTLLLALTASAIALLACKETKKSTDIIVKKVEKKAPAAPVRMQEYNQTSEATLANSHLNCVIHRQADDSLAIVKDETGRLVSCFKTEGNISNEDVTDTAKKGGN